MRRTLLLLAAVLVAAFGTALVYLYVRGADTRAQADQRTVIVYVATRDLSANSQFGPGMFTTMRVPAVARVADAIEAPSRFEGKYLQVPVAKGQQLLAGMFGARSPNGVPNGQAAVSVTVQTANQVAALLQPGDTVDVYRQHGSALIQVATGVKVYRIGGHNLPNTIITFVLDPLEAKILALAQASGDPLSLIIVGT